MGEPIDGAAARVADGLDHVSTLAPPFEVRQVVVAQGKQFRNGDPKNPFHIPAMLARSGKERVTDIATDFKVDESKVRKAFPSMEGLPAIPLVLAPDGSFFHFSARQGVIFIIRTVNTKTEYVKALLTEDAHVIYSGHARYGRGPCFGSGGESRGEEWEEGHGAHPNDDGILRMGFRYLSVPAFEPVEHGYTANLVPASVSMTAADCDPDLRGHLGGLHARTLPQIDDAIADHVANELKLSETLTQHVRNKDPAATWWTFGNGDKMEIALQAGWETTLSDPDDLGKLEPKCRVFCHFGCSTYKHNYPVVRKQKGWKHSGNERYAYWTTDLSTGIADVYWLQHLLTYPTFNAWKEWEPSLAYTVRKTNTLLKAGRHGFTII